jgi:hypothetical protein
MYKLSFEICRKSLVLAVEALDCPGIAIAHTYLANTKGCACIATTG